MSSSIVILSSVEWLVSDLSYFILRFKYIIIDPTAKAEYIYMYLFYNVVHLHPFTYTALIASTIR